MTGRRGTHGCNTLGAVITAAAIGLGGSATAEDVVRNERPQRPARPIDIVLPIHFPALPGQAPKILDGRPTAEALLEQLGDLHSAGRHQPALGVARQLVAALPDHPIGHYNLACVLSRLRRADAALASLNQAIDCGWRNVRHTVIDLDLVPLRKTEAFGAAVERMAALNRTERAPLSAPAWADVADFLEEHGPGLLRRHAVPGAAIVVIDGGRIVSSHGLGTVDRSTAAPMQPATTLCLQSPAPLLAMIALLDRPDGAAAIGRTLELLHESREARLEAAPPKRPRRRVAPAGGPARPDQTAAPAWLLPVAFGAASPREVAGTFEFLRLALADSGVPLEQHVTSTIIRPLNASVEFPPPGPLPAAVGPGHTVLGTPMTWTSVPTTGWVTASSLDLATLLASVPAETGRELADVLGDVRRAGYLPTGFATGNGRTAGVIEVAGESGGCGCLIRWDTGPRRAIVVLYNAQGGHRAAAEIAGMAIDLR